MEPSKKSHLPQSLVAVMSAILLCQYGCGGHSENELPRAEVSGTVTFNGQPLEEGVIRFVPVEGTPGPKTSATIKNGTFAADSNAGPVVGQHRIEIESTDDGGFAPDDEQALKRLHESGTKRIDVVRIPAIYNSRSTLTETISLDGPNEFNFELKSRKR